MKRKINRIEVIKGWIASCVTDEQLVNLRNRIIDEFGKAPEELRNAIEDQRIKIVKETVLYETFIKSIPTLAYYINF